MKSTDYFCTDPAYRETERTNDMTDNLPDRITSAREKLWHTNNANAVMCERLIRNFANV